MQYISQFRSLGMFAFVLMLTSLLVTGCSDNTTDPGSPDIDPLAADASAEVGDTVTRAEADSVRTNVQRNQADSNIVSIDTCISNVRSEYPGCEVLGVNLDYDSDTLTYEVVIRENGRTYVVSCDPETGEVRNRREVRNAYYTETIVITRVIHVNRARERSRQYVRGEVVEVNLENIDGRPTYVIVILTSRNEYVTIYVDAENGTGRRVSERSCSNTNDNDDGDDDDDNGRKKKKHGRGHYRRHHGHDDDERSPRGYGHRWHCHCTCEDDGGNNGGDSTLIRRAISADSAKALVRSYVDSATVTETRLNVLNDSTISYTIKLQRDSNTYEVKLNALNGVFTEAMQTGGNMDSSEFRPPVIRRDSVTVDSLVVLSVARTAAVTQFPGRVVGWTLKYDATEAKWIYTFEIQPATGDRKKVLVDAKTGAYIRTI